MRVLGHQLLCELRSLCSDKVASILRGSDLSNLSSFTWDTLLSEMSEHAPSLLGLLKICTVKRNKSHIYNTRRSAVMSLCVALLCKLQNKSMNLVQKLISLILYTGHCSKKVQYIIYVVLTIYISIITTIYYRCLSDFKS